MRKLEEFGGLSDTHLSAVIYSICVEDIKTVYESETGKEWDKLSEKNKLIMIKAVTKAFETDAWFETISIGLGEV